MAIPPISREELAHELMLRQQVRKAVRIIQERKNKKYIQELVEAVTFRETISDLIVEAATENPEISPSESTGISRLRAMLTGTNFLKDLKSYYMQLVTDEAQRKSFRAHVSQWVQDTLNRIAATDAGASLNEEVGINVEDEPENPFDLGIDADGNEIDPEEEEKEEKEEDLKAIEGEDETGRDIANMFFKNQEKNLVNYFGPLHSTSDQEDFSDYLIANTLLYMDEYEKLLSGDLEPVTNDEYEAAKADPVDTALDNPEL